MGDIMIRCPTLGTAVRTGLRTDTIVLDSMPADLAIPLRCPACKAIHTWVRGDAWIENDDIGNLGPVG